MGGPPGPGPSDPGPRPPAARNGRNLRIIESIPAAELTTSLRYALVATALSVVIGGMATAAIGAVLMGAGLLSRSPYELLPNSSFVQGLRKTPFPTTIPLVSVFSRHDLVCPWWSATLVPRPEESSVRNHMVRGVGHTALTYDPGVYRIVRTELRDAAQRFRERRQREQTEQKEEQEAIG
jgi:hypothetical protein